IHADFYIFLSGAYGSAILFEETLPSGTRKVVVKVARTEFDNMSIRSEEGFLQSLRGAEHIVQILYSGPGTFYRSSLVIEFVEHGHWEDIYERIHDAGRSIPNRVLWGIFLCLTRAVIAMAWPPNRNLGDPIWRETIQSKDPGLMAHRDFSLGNVLVGAWQKTDPEHRFSPITKVIDFGLAINMTPKEPLGNRRGIADNIAGIGRVISWLAGRHPAFEDRDEHLSDELQEMIFRCTDKDVEERPTLEELLEACENVVKNHTATDYQHLPSGQYEQDHEIDQFIQTFILNADI
ncbi:kinase-like domain-containing protein, partial [Hypomontagnella monticulosa]